MQKPVIQTSQTLLIAITMFCCWFVMPCSAQNYYYKQFTTEDGLPSNYVYGVVEDENGFIWVYTENGISKFDGYTFKNYTVKNGLPSNDIYWMLKDSNNCFWLGNIVGKICYLKNDTVQCIAGYEDCRISNIYKGNVRYTNTVPISHVTCNNKKIIHIYSIQYKNLNATTAKTFNKNERSIGSALLEGKLKVLTNKNYYEVENGLVNSIALNKIVKGTFKENKNFSHLVGSNRIVNDFLVGGLNSGLVFIKDKAQVNFFYDWKSIIGKTPKFGSIEINEQLETIIATNFGYAFFDNEHQLVKTLFFNNITDKYQLHRLFIDSKGNYWIGTEDGGLFFISKQKQKTELLIANKKNDFQFKKLIRRNKDILAFTGKGSIYAIKNKDFMLLKTLPNAKKIYDIETWENDKIIIGRTGKSLILHPNNSLEESTDNNSFQIEHVLNSKYDKSHSKGLLRNHKSFGISLDKQFCYWSDHFATYKYDFKSRSFFQIDDNRTQLIYCNTLNNKVYFAQNKTIKFLNENKLAKLIECEGVITCIFAIDDKYLLIATENAGLFELNLESGSLSKISNRNQIKTIIADEDYFLLASNEGVVKLKNKAANYEELYCYNRLDGLPDQQVNDILIDGNYIYAATNNGVAKIDKTVAILDTLDNAVNLKIRQFKAAQKKYDFNNLSDFTHKENDINIKYHFLDYASKGKINYAYKLSPIEKDWNFTTERQVNYAALKPGNFQFYLKAIDLRGKEHLLKTPLNFTIKKAFWQTYIFDAFVLISFLGLVGWVVFKREKMHRTKIRKEKVLNQKIIDLQIQSLRSQMNPHFIFNALGSIQYYIQDHKIEEADEYLALFAQLMRRYLDSAIDNFIKLKDEILLLEEYTELEQMRFETKFKTTIIVDENIDERRELLPSMLVQPFVENAINHGLQKRKMGGILKIKFSKSTENELTCEITDNGIGIENAKRHRKNKHKSRAMTNVENRVKIYDDSAIASLKVTTSTLCADKEFPGTKVKLQFINFNYYEELQSNNNRRRTKITKSTPN